jgi:hypothetical protein
MTLTEIKDKFEIDLTENNRNRYIVYLRIHYIENELKNGKIKYHISKELYLNHATVIYHLNLLSNYKKIKEFNEIGIAFKNKDINLFKDIEYRMLNVEYDKNAPILAVRKINKKDTPVVKKWSIQRISNALKFDNKSYLWNKDINIFNNEDYNILKTLEDNFVIKKSIVQLSTRSRK